MVILFSTRLVDEDVAEIRRATPAVLRGFILRALYPTTRLERVLITANRRYWLFHELSRRPAVQRRFRDEARSVLGGRRCAYEDIPRLEYVRRVILECTRLHTLT